MVTSPSSSASAEFLASSSLSRGHRFKRSAGPAPGSSVERERSAFRPGQAPGASVSPRGRGCQEEVTWLVRAEGLTEKPRRCCFLPGKRGDRCLKVGAEYFGQLPGLCTVAGRQRKGKLVRSREASRVRSLGQGEAGTGAGDGREGRCDRQFRALLGADTTFTAHWACKLINGPPAQSRKSLHSRNKVHASPDQEIPE